MKIRGKLSLKNGIKNQFKILKYNDLILFLNSQESNKKSGDFAQSRKVAASIVLPAITQITDTIVNPYF